MKHRKRKRCQECKKLIYGKSDLCPGCYKDKFYSSLMFLTEQEAN